MRMKENIFMQDGSRTHVSRKVEYDLFFKLDCGVTIYRSHHPEQE